MMRLQAVLDAKMGHMDQIQIAMFRDAIAVPGTTVIEGRFYDNGPLCLVAMLNGNQTASMLKSLAVISGGIPA